MALRRCILLVSCLLLGISVHAQRAEKALLDIAYKGDTTLCITFSTGDFGIVVTNGYCTLEAAGMRSAAPEAGRAALPQMSRLVSMPRGTTLSLNGSERGETVALPLPAGAEPLPWQGATLKETERQWVPLVKEQPAEDGVWQVEDLGAMGDRQLFRITVLPAAYDAASRSYRLTKACSATFTVAAKHQPLHTGKKLLVVSRPVFREGLQDFIQWKRQEGYVVEELYADTNKRDSVKALISPLFADATPLRPAPSHILIVGDAAQIQAFVGGSQPSGLTTHSTDLYYAEHTGDWLPDAFIGRWPVNDTAELGSVVRKTLRYEQCRDIDTAMLRRAIMVAGSESRQPAPVTTNGQVNYVSRVVKSSHPEVDTLCFHNPASATQTSDILGTINSGAALLNYTAHCTVGGWSSPSVTFSSIDTLEASQPMVYINNCCRSNDFSGTCFGEQLLRKENGGAIGVIGATNETLWEEDYYWAVGPKYPLSIEPVSDSLRQGAFDRMLYGGIHTMGELLHAGNMAVMASGTRFSRFYWEIYCLLGDPTLMPRLGAMQPLWLSAADSIELGATEIRISSAPGATVAATQGPRLLGATLCDEHRSTLLTFEAIDDTTPITLTATGPQMAPVAVTVRVTLPHGRAALLHGIETSDTSLSFQLTNTGTDTLYGLRVALAPDSLGATYNTDSISVDTLLPQASKHLAMSVGVTRWGRWWGGTLAVIGAYDDTLCSAAVAHWLHDTLPTLSFTVATADGRRINAIEPRTTYLLTAMAAGPHDSLSVHITSLPLGERLCAETSTADQQDTLHCTIITPDSVTHLHIEASVHRGNYVKQYSYYLEAGSRTPASGGLLGCYPWRNKEPQPWCVDSTTAHSGAASLRSGDIDYRQQSDLWLDVLLPQADSIVFWAKSSTEPTYDKLTFEVDGIVKNQLWGEYNWRRYAVALSAGSHTLRWHYHKDDADDGGSDCVWIDDLRMPMALWEAPYGCPDGVHEGITTPSTAIATRLFPNPADVLATIATTAHGTVTAELADIYGRTVSLQRHNTAGTIVIDTRAIPSGVYILLLHHSNGTERHKLIIQH